MTKYNTEKEVWKDIKGYEGRYKISNTGKVKSLPREVQLNGYVRTMPEIIMAEVYTPTGYAFVNLAKDGERKNLYIHRLVAEHYINNDRGYPEINHIDENKKNNHHKNLEWCTRKQNMNRGTVIERENSHPNTIESKKKGERVIGTCIKTGQKVRFPSMSEAGRNGFAQSSISRCVSREYKTHKGYTWELE